MNLLKWLSILFIVLALFYFAGPQPATPNYTVDLPNVPSNRFAIQQYIQNIESAHHLKKDNEARIVWANDSLKLMTEYAIVYLHGFSASQEEGDPVHKMIAKKFGCNLYLSRLQAHGVDTVNPLANFSALENWNSAKEAYAIAKKLGKKVILMSCSTGGTLALKLAATYSDIAALILYSPNVAINDKNAWLLNNHWGLQLAKLLVGEQREIDDTTQYYAQYWNRKYATSSLVQLEELLESTMKFSTFEKIKQPLLLLYFYKDELHQDPVVKVSAMKRMFAQIATPDSLKRQKALPNTGNHVICNKIKSGDVESVISETEKFLESTLHISKVN